MFNALSFDEKLTEKKGFGKCSKAFFAGRAVIKDKRVENFLWIDASFDGSVEGNIYVDTIFLPDGLLDKVIEHRLSKKAKIIINLSSSLDEVGTCDIKHGCSPVGYAEKLGLLEGAYVTGAVYLDKDDIDLINQSAAKVILTPSFTLGTGCGLPPARMLKTLGADVYVGCGSPEYNPEQDPVFEKRLLGLVTSGSLCIKDALGEDYLEMLINKNPN